MIDVGIDAAKDKHDCCILGGNGQTVREAFTFQNNHQGFEQLQTEIRRSSEAEGSGQIRAGVKRAELKPSWRRRNHGTEAIWEYTRGLLGVEGAACGEGASREAGEALLSKTGLPISVEPQNGISGRGIRIG